MYNLLLAFHIHGSSATMDSINHRLRSTVEFTVEKYPCISEPVQFKTVLFKAQLY